MNADVLSTPASHLARLSRSLSPPQLTLFSCKRSSRDPGPSSRVLGGRTCRHVFQTPRGPCSRVFWLLLFMLTECSPVFPRVHVLLTTAVTIPNTEAFLYKEENWPLPGLVCFRCLDRLGGSLTWGSCDLQNQTIAQICCVVRELSARLLSGARESRRWGKVGAKAGLCL